MGLLDFHHRWIRPEIRRRRRPVVLEIGVAQGRHSRRLLGACLLRGGRLISIDPAPDARIRRLLRAVPLATLLTEPSLEALPRLAAARRRVDIAIVDGDHNYYTVLRELAWIEQLLTKDGIIFLHDIAWPYGRRDLYYVPERIPAAERQPFGQGGMARGQCALLERGGMNAGLCNALLEGGPKNGVLTAVEDFVAERDGVWSLTLVEEQWGLAILRRR